LYWFTVRGNLPGQSFRRGSTRKIKTLRVEMIHPLGS
jgi:hypothetical protein